MTDLQTTFGVINLSIMHGRPAILNLKETLEAFVEHRRDVVTRRTRFELRQAEEQREIVEGLGMAVTDVDLVVKTIRESADPEVARAPSCAAAPGPRGLRPRAGARRARSTRRRSGRRTRSPSARPRPSSRCASRASRASSTRSSRPSTASSATRSRAYRAILADPKLLFDVIVMELEEIRASTPTSAAPRSSTTRRRSRTRTSSRRGHGRHHLPRRLHQATTPADYRAQKRGGKGQDRHGGARRGLGDPALRRVDARVRLLLQRQGEGLRQEGLRDPLARARARGARS
jgi:DNA gyrase subunit A